MPNLKTENNSLKACGESLDPQTLELAYQASLPLLIEREIYRYDPKAIRRNYQLGTLHNEWNELLLNYQNLNILAPRDHLKTFFFSEILPLELAKRNPGCRIQIYRLNDGLGVESLDKIKRYATFPRWVNLRRNAELDNKTQLRLGNGSEIYSGGFWSGARGGHPDFMIFDDVIDTQVMYSDDQNAKSKERMALEFMPMAEKETRMIIIGTIQRDDDLYSVDWEKVQGEELGEPQHWASRVYDAIVDEEKKLTLFPEKWSWNALMKKKSEIVQLTGSMFFDKEYRNQAINKKGRIIKAEWRRTYKELPRNLKIVTGWDLSTGKKEDEGDWSAKVTIGIDRKNGNIYIIHVARWRIEFGERVRKLIGFGRQEKPVKIKVEDNTFQTDTVRTAKRNSMLPIEGVQTTKNKVQKFREELAPLFENGKVYFLEGDSAQQEMWEELLALPNGKYDDRADALAIAIKGEQYLTNGNNYIVVI